MRICFFAPANSAHTIKWCNYFISQGYEVHVVSFTDGEINGATVHLVRQKSLAEESDLKKLMYLMAASRVQKIIKSIKPDIISVHYATSYGVVAALANLKNYVLSVWGSDIYEFPKRSKIHQILLRYSLKKASYLFSTSQAMAQEASLYTNKKFHITPFGVRMDRFSPEKRNRKGGSFTVGTVKTLAPIYGIDILLKGVALVQCEHPEIPLAVRIAGRGPEEIAYKELAQKLGIDEIVTWLGYIPQEQAAREWANMDVAIICSNSESFGVSAVEAQACGCPVIITEISGLMEATKPGTTSVVVPVGNERAVADAIVSLYFDPKHRAQMGEAGVQYVAENFEYMACFQRIEKLLVELVVDKKI